MTIRQIKAFRNRCNNLDDTTNELFVESTNTKFGRLVSILRIGSNPNTNTNIWYATVSLFDVKDEPLPLNKLPRTAIKQLIDEAFGLLSGVGSGETYKIIGSIGIHYFKNLSTEENVSIDKLS